MEKDTKQGNIERFLKLDAPKQNRILNAAMKEFQYGYKKASTDIIVKEAGISKGLIFHYFGTKEQLFTFLVRYALELIQRDYHSMLNLDSPDILEVFWQRALLKKDIKNQHPHLHNFLNGVYTHWEDSPNMEDMTVFEKEWEDVYDELYAQCNVELFRDDIDHKKAIDIIIYTMDGLFEEEEVTSTGGGDDENYERFLETLRGYLDTFRQCFYK